MFGREPLFLLGSKGDDVLLESKEPKTRGFRFPRPPKRPRRGEDCGVRALAEMQRFCFAASVLRSA